MRAGHAPTNSTPAFFSRPLYTLFSRAISLDCKGHEGTGFGYEQGRRRYKSGPSPIAAIARRCAFQTKPRPCQAAHQSSVRRSGCLPALGKTQEQHLFGNERLPVELWLPRDLPAKPLRILKMIPELRPANKTHAVQDKLDEE